MLTPRLVKVGHRLPLILLLVALCSVIPSPSPASAVQSIPTATSVAIWRGGTDDPRWSNPTNWDGGVVPGPNDGVRFPAGAGDTIVDAAFAGRIASITLDDGYTGTLTLARALDVRGALDVNSGTVVGGADLLSAETLTIAQGATLRLGTNGKLNLAGDGVPLNGEGLLDTTTNAPNSVEYTGHATGDLTMAGPATAYHALAEAGRQTDAQPGRPLSDAGKALPLAPTTFAISSSLALNPDESNLHSAVIDTVNGFAYFGTYNYTS